MNGIIGMTELCLTTEVDSEQKTYLNAVKDSADNLLSIINDILDFSRIEVGKIERDDVPFLLRTALGLTLQGIAVRAAEKGLEVLFDVSRETPDALVGDPGRLRQILINLVGNAIKFTSRGNVQLLVQLVEEDDEGCLLSFTVQDSGIGISPEKMKKIFEPFEQGDLSTTKSYGGTGLGLAISKNLVELLGGAIRVESVVGKGSTFIFTARFGMQRSVSAVPASQPLRGRSALVVDDVALNRDLLAQFLDTWGVASTRAGDGRNALRLMAEAHAAGRPFDFVLTDIQMPEYDGWQLVEDIRSHPEYDRTFCVMMPSAGMRGDSRRCQELNVNGYLTKPLVFSEVQDLLCLLMAPGALGPTEVKPAVTRYQLLENRLRRTVLVADDVPVNQILIKTILTRFGHAVTIVENGEEALKAWLNGRYDIIFMDVQMPVMDGFQATRRIRELEESQGGHVPIVAMTAYAMKEDMERCRESGMDDYISKPFQADDVVTVMGRLLGTGEGEYQPVSTQQHCSNGADDSVKPSAELAVTASQSEVPELPVFDLDDLLKRLGGNQEMVPLFTDMFIRNTAAFIASLQQALCDGDDDGVRVQAHSIKGAAANISAPRIVKTAAFLETLARDRQQRELWGGLAEQLDGEIKEFVKNCEER